MKILAERRFTPDDQNAFAELSGDFNPMHVDEVAARRLLFGAPVVHGVHLVAWALDSLIASSPRGRAVLEHLSANFTRGVLVGETASVAVDSDAEEFTLRVQCDQSDRASIRGKFGTPLERLEPLPPMVPQPCRELDLAAASQARGTLALSFDAAAARRLFPHLSVFVPPFQIAVLCATTRLVGMECPGLHSLYRGMDLEFTGENASGPPELQFRVIQAQRFGALRLAIEGPGFRGELQALLRPAPRLQPACTALVHLVEPGEFSSQRAVVIGASRGLGEVAAKLLALGGAAVYITYHRGKSDAAAIVADIQASGGTCEAAAFDCQNPQPLPLPHPPTHLYYFATPHITSDKNVAFSPQRFDDYSRYYVTGFARTALALGSEVPSLNLFYPSTTFLDQAPPNMAEYCAAKAAGEELCKQLAQRFPQWRFHAPRLPPLPTDQNNGFVRPKMEAAETVLLRHLRRFQR